MKQLIILFISLIIAGCSSMNIPPKLNTPSFAEKGEMEIELGASTNSFYQNIGYSITDKFALISTGLISYDFLYRNEYDSYNTGGLYYTYLPSPYEVKYIDFGFGLFDKNTYNLKSIYAGTGIGESNYRYKYSNDGGQQYRRKNSYNSFFIQLNYGEKMENMEYGFITRLSYIHYPFESQILNSNPLNDDIASYNEYNIFGIQPCLYLNIHKNRFLYTFNIGAYLTNYNKYSDWLVRDYPQNTLIHLSVGLKYKIGKE